MTDIQFTPNFNLTEFLHDGDTPPNLVQVENLHRLAWALQAIRDIVHSPIIINSGYRSEAHNKAVGGVKNSLHRKGLAADIVVLDMQPKAFQHFMTNWSGGMGMYEDYTHLDIRGSRARWI